MSDQLAALLAGIAHNESGGQADPYAAQGPATRSGDHAYGKYQVMGSNIPQWSQQVLGRSESPLQFLHDPAAQEAIARAKVGSYLAQTHSPADAASMWFTGRPLAHGGAGAADANGMTGQRYAALATGQPVGIPAMVAVAPQPQGGSAQPTPSAPPEPPPIDWGSIIAANIPQKPAVDPIAQRLAAGSDSPAQGQAPQFNLTAGTAPNLLLNG